MTSFLFWNINRKNLQRPIVNLVRKYDIDVLMLAECQIEAGVLLNELNEGYRFSYHCLPDENYEKIKVFARFSGDLIQPIRDEPIREPPRLTIRHLQLPGLTDILLAITHCSSKLYREDVDQTIECVKLSESIKAAERQVGHARTVLVGDLNMNPFEDGVVIAGGLHGVMSRSIAEKEARVVQSQKYLFFYNPMWGLLGDGTQGPSGTYYYKSSKQKEFFWNMLDQVLIRPDLLPRFDNKNLEIPESDGEISLLSKKGLPNKDVASDHLPIVFRLEL